MFISKVENLSRHSHAKVEIKCQFGLVDNCKGINKISYLIMLKHKNNGAMFQSQTIDVVVATKR